MPELRKDPVLGRWVIIATERAKRPFVFVQGTTEKKKHGFCPFCRGNEEHTPPEVMSYRSSGTGHNQPGWWIRVVPNKFPALEIEGAENRAGEGMYDKMNGIGAHEVVIESPDHDKGLADQDQKQIEEIIWAFRDRTVELRKDARLRYAMIFKNHGSEAGASLDHPHSQIIALPVVPKRVQEEINGAQQYYSYKERCVYCDMIRQELKDGTRIVAENESFLSFAPFAARFPFETWVLPKTHAARFQEITKNEVTELAAILKHLLQRYKAVLDDPPYNFMFHSLPFSDGSEKIYHWHIEVIPKLTKIAGFEWGTGFYINPTPPEEAAKSLRSDAPVIDAATSSAQSA